MWKSLRAKNTYLRSENGDPTCAGKPADESGLSPAPLLVPVAEAAHVVHIVPPVCPMDQPVHGNPFHLHGQAKPAHAKDPPCGPLVRRHSGGRLRAGKPADESGLSPAPLLVPVAEAPHVIHIIPPVYPMGQLVHGNPFTCMARQSPSMPGLRFADRLYAAHAADAYASGKPADEGKLSSGFLIRPGSRSSARNSHCPASFP